MVEPGHRTPNDLQRVERRRIILNLRRGGLQLDEIVRALQNLNPPIIMSRPAVGRIIQRYLDRVHAEDAETAAQLRVLENERLDQLWRRYMKLALEGDVKAAQLLIRISERRAKMNGLDAPTQIQHGGVMQHLHAIGVNMDEVKRGEEAFKTASFGEAIPDIKVDIVTDDEPLEDGEEEVAALPVSTDGDS